MKLLVQVETKMGKDYYSVLQITRSAKDTDIKQAYRKIALNFHPIKNPGDRHAADKFRESSEAYDVLSNRNITVLIKFCEHKYSI